MKNKLYLNIGGLGNSGKGILTDYFREFNDIYVPRGDFEFNLLRAPGGIMDLYYSLGTNWTPIRADDAIRRFKQLVKRLASRPNYKEVFDSCGANYETFFPGFKKLSQDFIDQLIDFTYRGLWPYVSYHRCKLTHIYHRLKNKVPSLNYNEKIYFACGIDLDIKINNYIYNLLDLATKDPVNIYITHNAMEPFEIDRYLKLLTNFKSIIVTRDPRDIYTNINLGNKEETGLYSKIKPNKYNISAASNLNNFIKYQQKILSYLKKMENDNLLVINFNNFINNYEKVDKQIRLFLNITEEEHINKKKFFNPNHSVRNVGIYNDYEFQNEIKLIEKRLENYWKF